MAIRPTARMVRNSTNMVTRRSRDNRVIFVASSLDSIREPLGQTVMRDGAKAGPGQRRNPQTDTSAKRFRLLRSAWLGRAAQDRSEDVLQRLLGVIDQSVKNWDSQ